MFVDIVFPDKNEKKFIERAKALGYNAICFIYNHKKEKIKTDFVTFSGLISDKPKNKKNIDLIIKESGEDRKTFERGKFDLIFNLENKKRSDFIHQRNSGLNHILCRLAKKKNTYIGISFSNLLEQRPFNRARLIGRIEQNLKLCKKYNVCVIFASFAHHPEQMRSPQDLRALLNCIFSDEKLTKQSILNLGLLLKENIKKKDKNYISKDFKVIEE